MVTSPALNYLRDPERIWEQTLTVIRELTDFGAFTPDQIQIIIHLVLTCGEPLLASKIRFSPNAIDAGKKSIKHRSHILCDFDTVNTGLDAGLLYQEPMNFVNRATVISEAKALKQTRAMTAVDVWRKYLNNAICIFGSSGSALCRLLELLHEDEVKKPALIIAMNPGFLNAPLGKDYLIEHQQALGVEYILIEGRWGGTMFATSTLNALLKLQREIYV